jgi:2-haloacid dehalogenase
VPAWQAFRETNAQLERFAKKFELGILSNIDDKLLGATRRHFRSDFDLVVTAQQVRSYKPDPAHFKECARRIGPMKKNWVHIASGYPTDIEPAAKEKIPVIWVNRHGEEAEGTRKPDAEVKTFRDAGKLLKAA